jgi:hypothetical protein
MMNIDDDDDNDDDCVLNVSSGVAAEVTGIV